LGADKVRPALLVQVHSNRLAPEKHAGVICVGRGHCRLGVTGEIRFTIGCADIVARIKIQIDLGIANGEITSAGGWWLMHPE